MPKISALRLQQRGKLQEALDQLGHVLELVNERAAGEVGALDAEQDTSGLAGRLEALRFDALAPGLQLLGAVQRRLAIHCLPETTTA